MNKRYYEHTLPIIRGSLSNTYVPARVRFIFVRIEKRDTLRVEKADTVYREKSAKTRTVKENKPMFGTFFYTSGWIAWILVIVGSGIWFRYKVKKGEK